MLIGEVKAVRAYTDEHVAQILGYLRASHTEHGLLINFGTAKYQIKNTSGPPAAMQRSNDHAVPILRILRFFAARGPV
jgi:hypothetical protein